MKSITNQVSADGMRENVGAFVIEESRIRKVE
jgi:hypothetical protein